MQTERSGDMSGESEAIRLLIKRCNDLEDEKHSFARSQAIELGKWIHEDDCDFYYDNIVGAWRKLVDDKLYSDDEVHTAFLDHQKKQQEGKGE